MEFVAIDVETANADVASICQVGLALYRDGGLVEEWKTYVDPQDHFMGVNISIHGIDAAMVRGGPTLPEVSGTICRFLDDRVSLAHTGFDRASIRQAFAKYSLRHPRCTWLDSAKVVRRTWSEFSRRGYGLGNVCAFLGYEYGAHDALEDAKAAAHVFHAAVERTGLDVEGWLRRVGQPIGPGGCRSRPRRDFAE